MKKILLAAVAALAIMGCSQNEEIENAGQKAQINFGTVVRTSTKAAITDNTSFKAFKVNAYIVDEANIGTAGLGNAYMNGIEYTGIKGGWTTNGGTFYWPLNEEMHFFAYPSGVTIEKEDTGYPFVNFTVGDGATTQTDLVVAYEKVTTKPAGNKVTLNFKHILTRINFSYRPENTDYTYTISKIEIKDVKGGVAKYTFGATGAWSLTGATSKSYLYPIGTNALAEGYYPLETENGSLMLLPQSVAGKVISISYTTTKDDHTYYDGTKNITLPVDATWGIGSNIRYKMTLPVGAESIIFDTDVEDPTEETPSL